MSELLQVSASSCSGEGAQQQGVGDAGGCLSVVRTNQKYSSKEQRNTAARNREIQQQGIEKYSRIEENSMTLRLSTGYQSRQWVSITNLI